MKRIGILPLLVLGLAIPAMALTNLSDSMGGSQTVSGGPHYDAIWTLSEGNSATVSVMGEPIRISDLDADQGFVNRVRISGQSVTNLAEGDNTTIDGVRVIALNVDATQATFAFMAQNGTNATSGKSSRSTLTSDTESHSYLARSRGSDVDNDGIVEIFVVFGGQDDFQPATSAERTQMENTVDLLHGSITTAYGMASSGSDTRGDTTYPIGQNTLTE